MGRGMSVRTGRIIENNDNCISLLFFSVEDGSQTEDKEYADAKPHYQDKELHAGEWFTIDRFLQTV